MLNKNVKAAICICAIAATIFSCKKNEADPAPQPLSASEAKTSLGDDNYVADSVAVVEVQNSAALKAANNLGNLGAGDFAVDVSSLSLRSSGSNELAYTSFFKQLYELTDVVNPANSSARIPARATGTWEFYIITTSGFYTSGDFKQTSDAPADGIVIKFPTNYDSYNSTVTSIVNNAEYSVTNIQTTVVSYKECNYDYSTSNPTKTIVTKKDTSLTSLKASLKIDGTEVLKVDYSVTYGSSQTPTSASYTATFGDYTATYSANASETSTSVNGVWKKNGDVIAGVEYEITGTALNQAATDPCNDTASKVDNYTSIHIKRIRKEVTLDYTIQIKTLLEEILKVTSATTPEQAVAIYNKYFTMTLTKTSTGQKIADVVIVYDASDPNLYVLKVKYTDGTTELASTAYKGFKSNNPFSFID